LKWDFRSAFVVLLVTFAATVHAETVAGDKVNCRSAPRASAPVLGVLRRGQDEPVLSTADGWRYGAKRPTNAALTS
jgi:hypothetical protein